MYDVIIIGAGPAGISASLYTQRANLKTLVIYKEEGALEKAKQISNYYGVKNGTSGKELYEEGKKQAECLGVELIEDEVTNIKKENEYFKVQMLNKEIISKTIIIATGNKKNKPQIKGIDKFEGKGISYCAICDGFFYKNKNVSVIGDGNYAISEVIDLNNIVQKTTILTNNSVNKIPEYKLNNVEINNKKIKEIKGSNRVEKVVFEDDSELYVDGIFIAQGIAGSIEFAKKVGAKTREGVISVNENMETNVEGLYACGDCTGGLYQISKAVYEGTKAGLQVIKYLKNNKIKF